MDTKLKVTTFPILSYRNSKNEEIFWNTYTGKKAYKAEELMDEDKEYAQCFIENEFMIGMAMQYDEKSSMVCVFFAYLDTRTEKDSIKNQKSKWQVFDRVYIDKYKRIHTRMYKNNYVFKLLEKDIKEVEGKSLEELLSVFAKYKNTRYHIIQDFCDFPFFNMNMTYVFIDQPPVEDNNYHEVCLNLDDRHATYRMELYSWQKDFLVEPFRMLFGNIIHYIEYRQSLENSIYYFTIDELSSVYKLYDYMTNYEKHKCTGYFTVMEPPNFRKDGLDGKFPLRAIEDIELPEELEIGIVDRARAMDKYKIFHFYSFAITERIEDGFVVRCFYISKYCDEMVEMFRIYKTKDKLEHYVNHSGTFVFAPRLLLKPVYYMHLDEIPEETVLGTDMEYVREAVNDLPPVCRTAALLQFMYEPYLEGLYKSEFKEVIKYSLISYSNMEYERGMYSYFQFLNWDENKTFYENLMLNKYQVTRLAEIMNQKVILVTTNKTTVSLDAILIYRLIMAPIYMIIKNDFSDIRRDIFDIRSLDNNTSDIGFNILLKLLEFDETVDIKTAQNIMIKTVNNNINDIPFWERFGSFAGSGSVLIRAIILSMHEQYGLKTISNTIFKLLSIDHCMLQIYDDYAYIAAQNNQRISISFESKEEIERLHDDMVEYVQKNKMKANEKKWKERRGMWKQFEYSDDTYVIIAPKKQEDMQKEGLALNHCVGGYITKVAEGDTNVVFLRKKTALKKPFITIEIDNNNVIQQVHGKNNSNAPEKIKPFLEAWAKEKNLSIGTYNQVR